ncbi:MAG: sporulation integral membrane protein YtvI [Clostridiales bacterium]|nr:sporulation integral membrane protein YtvI [Clostridiales bacterium]
MEREERLKRQRELLVNIAFFAVCTALVWAVFKAAGSVLLPFVAAFFVAWMLSFPIDWIAKRLHMKRSIVSVFIVLLFYVLAGCLLFFLGNRLIGLAYDLLNDASAFFSEEVFPILGHLVNRVEKILNAFSPETQAVLGENESERALKKAGEVFSKLSETAIMGVSKTAAGIPGFFMQMLIAVIATVFTELEFPSIRRFLWQQVPPKYRALMEGGRMYVTGTLRKCILSYCLIFLLTFLELWLGLAVLGIKRASVIAILIAVLDILPVLGTGTVLLPWCILAFATGNVKIGVGVLILYLMVTVVRNIAEPRLVGHQMGLPPFVMLPCMLVGLKMFGIVGLFGLPLCVALLKNLNDEGILHIFR